MAAKAAGLCAGTPSSTFGPQALGGEGQRYSSRPRASTPPENLFGEHQLHLPLALANQQEPAEAQVTRPDHGRRIGSDPAHRGPTLAEEAASLALGGGHPGLGQEIDDGHA